MARSSRQFHIPFPTSDWQKTGTGTERQSKTSSKTWLPYRSFEQKGKEVLSSSHSERNPTSSSSYDIVTLSFHQRQFRYAFVYIPLQRLGELAPLHSGGLAPKTSSGTICKIGKPNYRFSSKTVLGCHSKGVFGQAKHPRSSSAEAFVEQALAE